MMQYIADKTKASQDTITLVLKHEQAFNNKAHENAKGKDVDINGDDLADNILSRKDMKLNELTVESILGYWNGLLDEQESYGVRRFS
ncbi:hypothetical protein [Paenibacillus sp. P3E]|uniref:hypothetical protein n=1 Tax=Paenibacillus sp. P3E TaxID=1349435 RepID=UPI000AECC33C|nr:hypothetical protein [Paenibacillus sp. P3E]